MGPTTTTDPDVAPFSQVLRAATARAHREAAGEDFLGDLVAGRRGRDDLVRMLAQLWFVYRELEAVDADALAPPVAAVVDPALFRAPRIEADLVALVGERWREALVELPATARYRERIAAVAGEADPVRFLAHHYTRYLGDLSGGQWIGRRVSEALDLAPEEWSFYRFDAIADPEAYTAGYRARLDDLGLDHDERDVLVREVLAAYAANGAMLGELAAPFDRPTRDAVVDHMNADHRDHSLLVVRTLGGVPAATAAVLVDVDVAGAHFAVDVPGGSPTVTVPWSGEVPDRAAIRHEFVAMAEQAERLLPS